MSKRTERIAAAKARSADETAELRRKERERPISQAARFIEGPAKGFTLAEVAAQQEEAKRKDKEERAQLQQGRI